MNSDEASRSNGSRALTLLATHSAKRRTASYSEPDVNPPAEGKPRLRGIRAAVLRRTWSSGFDSSRVISGDPTIESVLLVGPKIPQIRHLQPGVPVVVLAQTAPEYLVARPAPESSSDYRHYQAGGAYIVFDGCFEEWADVFGHSLPIPLHDYRERSRGL